MEKKNQNRETELKGTKSRAIACQVPGFLLCGGEESIRAIGGVSLTQLQSRYSHQFLQNNMSTGTANDIV